MAKYKFTALKMPAYNEACWKTLRDESSTHQCASSYMVSRLTVGVSKPFADANPDLVGVFGKVRFPMDFLNQTILEMTTKKIDGAAMATQFLKTSQDMWKQWVPADVAQKIAGSLKGA